MSLRNEAYVFHQQNPIIFDLVEKYAAQAMRAGHQHYGIATIWERIRWEMTVVRPQGTAFKMPNNHRAYYARMWLQKYPQYPDFFRIAELRSERSFPMDRYGRALDPQDNPE